MTKEKLTEKEIKEIESWSCYYMNEEGNENDFKRVKKILEKIKKLNELYEKLNDVISQYEMMKDISRRD